MITRRALVVPFTKMNGAGNDFIVLDSRFLRFSDDELGALAAQFCPRRTGVGADGLLALDDALDDALEDAHFRMRYRNADGSLGTMCGNGARCLARFAARAGLGDLEGDDVRLHFETDGGDYRATVPGRDASGPVTLAIPPARDLEDAGLADRSVTRIWTGTEHAVLFVEDAREADVAAIGPAVRRDAAFEPTGTNVNFVEVAGASRLVVRTFEKGVEAETLACGTGAVASAVVAHHAGRVAGRTVKVEMPGGVLEVGIGPDGQPQTLAGPAETVFEGTLEWTGM